jgi:Zn finger protein HypA/HybF involved in hydrogenase expression
LAPGPDSRAISGAVETDQIQRTEHIQLIIGQESGAEINRVDFAFSILNFLIGLSIS